MFELRLAAVIVFIGLIVAQIINAIRKPLPHNDSAGDDGGYSFDDGNANCGDSGDCGDGGGGD